MTIVSSSGQRSGCVRLEKKAVRCEIDLRCADRVNFITRCDCLAVVQSGRGKGISRCHECDAVYLFESYQPTLLRSEGYTGSATLIITERFFSVVQNKPRTSKRQNPDGGTENPTSREEVPNSRIYVLLSLSLD